jgi:hypothetical protein
VKSRAGAVNHDGPFAAQSRNTLTTLVKRPQTPMTETGEFMKKPLLLLVAAMLYACAAQEKEPNVNLGGYPPEFRAGYLDGCESAKSTAGQKKDLQRFKREPQYATGWRDGFDICSKQKK